MNWLPLESEMLTSVAYDEEQQMLQLRFRGTGDVYCYFEVPVTKYEAFLDAESHGRFFLAYIRGHFRYERMAKLQIA